MITACKQATTYEEGVRRRWFFALFPHKKTTSFCKGLSVLEISSSLTLFPDFSPGICVKTGKIWAKGFFFEEEAGMIEVSTSREEMGEWTVKSFSHEITGCLRQSAREAELFSTDSTAQ